MLAVFLIAAAPAAAQSWETIRTNIPCAVGDWTYFVRRGQNANKLLIEFEGGGGCWDADTCSPGGPYKADVNIQSTLNGLNNGNGVTDHTDPRNPFQEWTHVFVPYCSGDIFTGDNLPEWGVEHRGWRHGAAAFDWVEANLPNPTHVMVTGCSAGGYGATFWAPVFFQLFRRTAPSAKLFGFFDSSAGIGSQSQLAGMHADLNQTDFLLQGQVPEYANLNFSFADPESYKEFSSDLLAMMSREYPESIVSVFTANYDSVQYFYTVLGGLLYTPEDWSNGMREVSRLAVEKGAGNVGIWINPGASHCIIPYQGFYNTQVNGILLHEWLADMVNERPIPLMVDCRDDNVPAC